VLGLSPDEVPPPRLAPAVPRVGETIGLALASSPWNDGAESIVNDVIATLRQAFPHFRLVALDRAAASCLGGEMLEADPDTLAGLELVVATDNSTAHAAGAAGAPLWLLLGDSLHWMWGREGRLSRWYPAARLFRAGERGWQGVADELAPRPWPSLRQDCRTLSPSADLQRQPKG
jgi:hypothetical protein